MEANVITGDIKELFSFEIKPRHDPLCDQYSRIFMVKILLVATVIIGVNSVTDTVSCIIPQSLDLCGDSGDSTCVFIVAACWIQGMYVYKELMDKHDRVAYYGIPIDMDQEGVINGTNNLCVLKPKLGAVQNPNCVEMTKTFYLQYQWMAFFLGVLAILYYMPYVVYSKVNKDLILLKESVKSEEASSNHIAIAFFKRDKSTKLRGRLVVIMNLVVKMLYIAASLICFLALDFVLHGEYFYYGKQWIDWAQLDDAIQYDYMGKRDLPKPGNKLLPPFGYCEFYESARDIKTTKANKIKVVCEISQHILYQYTLLFLWFCIVAGIVISGVGFFSRLMKYAKNMCLLRTIARKIGVNFLTLREMDYLAYIEERDPDLYSELIEELKEKEDLKKENWD